MSEFSRALPDRPNLRYLKLEAKRRLAAGEFTTLHEAQLAIAREHGLSSWTALKQLVGAGGDPANPALAQVRWVISRFREAGGPAWTAPDGDELGEHFTEHFLRVLPPETMVSTLTGVAARLSEELLVTATGPSFVRARIADLRIEAAAEPGPPHRLTGLRMYPTGGRVTDARVAEPPTRTSGPVPARVAEVAEDAFTEAGLVGLLAAGGAAGDGGHPMWALARGWADLDGGEPLRPDHRFPAYAITKPVTATAVLCLVAEGRVGLDDPANRHLRTIALADDTVTVRELLSHTGGVDGPDTMFGDGVPELTSLVGQVVSCGGTRGDFAYSNGGYAVLGRLIADVTGAPYAVAVTRMVLEPLGMHDSWFPTSRPDGHVISGHRLGDDGAFSPEPTRIFTVPAAGGLWTTVGDLVRFGLGWSGLLTREPADEAVRPHAALAATGSHVGLGWLVNQAKDVYGHAGSGPGAATSLFVRPGTGEVYVAHTNRLVPIEPVNARLARPIA